MAFSHRFKSYGAQTDRTSVCFESLKKEILDLKDLDDFHYQLKGYWNLSESDLKWYFQDNWKDDLNKKPSLVELCVVNEMVYRFPADHYKDLTKRRVIEPAHKRSQACYIARMLGEMHTGTHKRVNQILRILTQYVLVERIHPPDQVKPVYNLRGDNPRVCWESERVALDRTDTNFVDGFSALTVNEAGSHSTPTPDCQSDVGELSTQDTADVVCTHVQKVELENFHEMYSSDKFVLFATVMNVVGILVSVEEQIPWPVLLKYYNHGMDEEQICANRDKLLTMAYEALENGLTLPAQEAITFLILQITMNLIYPQGNQYEKFNDEEDIDHFYLEGWFRKFVMNKDGLHHRLKQTLFWIVASWRETMCDVGYTGCPYGGNLKLVLGMEYATAYAKYKTVT